MEILSENKPENNAYHKVIKSEIEKLTLVVSATSAGYHAGNYSIIKINDQDTYNMRSSN